MTTAQPNSIDVMASWLEQSLSFFRQAQNVVHDPEASDAFRTAADLRALLLNDLRASAAVGNSTPESAGLPESLSYAVLQQRFDPHRPERSALDLLQRETAMLALIERVFRESTNFRVRRLMQNCVQLFQRDARIWSRLARRLTRAA